MCLCCRAKPSANSFGTSPCCLGSAHHSVMPSLASTDSFSRTTFVKQCPYRNPRHTTFGCRPAFSHLAPCDRAIRRPKLALPKASPSQSSPRIVARITLRVRRLSPPTLVALRSVPTAQQSPSFRHDRFVAEDLRLYLSPSRIISFAERISNCQRASGVIAFPLCCASSVIRGCSCHIRRTEHQWRRMQTNLRLSQRTPILP